MSYITIHMQDPFNDWNVMLAQAYAAGSPFLSWKSFHPEDYLEAQAVSPGIRFIYRQWADDQNQGGWVERAKISPQEANNAADEFILMFRDSVNQHMGTDRNGLKFCESLNEEYPTGDPDKLHGIVEFDRAFVRRLPVHCPGAQPVVFCAAIGNPDHSDWATLIDLAGETEAAGGAFGYHGYTGVLNGRDWVESEQHAYDLHLRALISLDPYLVQRGIRVNHFYGEGGPTKCGSGGYGPLPIPGWRHTDVYDNSTPAYIDHIARLDTLITNTQVAREGRFWGVALFTKPGRGQWDTFDVPAQAVADYVASHPSPPPEEPPMKRVLKSQSRLEPLPADANEIVFELKNEEGVVRERLVTEIPADTDYLTVDTWYNPDLDDVIRPLGCDVSHWQGSINFQTMRAAGAYYVFMKATEHITHRDSRFAEYWPAAGAAGLLRSAYHFFRFANDPVAQANHFVDRVQTVTEDSPPELPLVVDVEDTNTPASREALKAFLDRVEARTGKKCIIYTGSWWWGPRLHGTTWAKDYLLWEAEYTHDPTGNPVIDSDWPTWAFWQYSNQGQGVEYGVASRTVDLNVFNGKLSELRHLS